MTQVITACVLALIYGVALFLTKKDILIFILTAFITWAYYAVILEILGSYVYENADILQWATMLLGISYISVGYAISNSLRYVFYGFGSLAILGAGIFVGGLFDIIYILILFGAFYGSVYLKSRAMLIIASFFLMAYIMKLTAEYFSSFVSWPLMLIFSGFVLIGIGYATYYVNKKFISS